MLLVKIIMTILAIIGAIYPAIGWHILNDGKAQSVEPTKAYVLFNRVIFISIIAVLWLVFPF